VFAGDENVRGEVRQFMALMRQLAMKSDAAVLLLAHPSVAGLNNGKGTSGSTGWNNAARARLYFSGTTKNQDSDEPDTGSRELRVMKSNYGPPGETVRVRWQRGVFVPESIGSAVKRAAAEAPIDDAFLRCLDVATAQGRNVSAKKSITYAPAVFEAMPEAAGFKSKALMMAMERLFSAGRIKVEASGSESKRREILVRSATAITGGRGP
jgi:RecA-family ATPase